MCSSSLSLCFVLFYSLAADHHGRRGLASLAVVQVAALLQQQHDELNRRQQREGEAGVGAPVVARDLIGGLDLARQ